MAPPSTTPITAVEAAERRHQVEAAIHTNAMEGLQVSDGARADAEDYINGLISADELEARVFARHGL